MRILVLLLLSFAVALGMPALPPSVPQSPVLPKEEQSPLLGDLIPAQGHVEVENPAPQARLSYTEVLKVQPEVNVELKAEPEVKGEEAGIEAKVKSEDKVEEKSEAGKEVQVEPEVKVEPQLKAKPEVEVEPEAQVKSEDVVEEMFEARQEVQVEPEVKVEPEVEPDFRVESDVQMEPPLLDKAQEQMNLDRQTDPLLSIQERHIDMEGKYERQGDDFEPLDENMTPDNTELSEVKKSMMAAFQNPTLAVEPQPEVEEEEGLVKMRNYVSGEELEPKTIEKHFGNQYLRPDAANLEEEQQLDTMEQQMPLSENYYPNEEARIGVRPEGSVYSLMREEDRPVFDEQIEGAGRRFLPNPERQGLGYCPGVVFEGKCYEFFREPERFADAEFYCQEHFIDGHLASITTPRIHRAVMELMLRKIGTYTRTWVGGLRFLDTGRFVWLDGSIWYYSDWLDGEPNNTENVEDCLELLAFGNGKFNDFTCWEPQAFICSYPYE